MSNQVERSDQRGVLDLGSGLEALRQSPEFRGPVEPLDGHDHSNDHFALIYESRDEQLAAAIPFVRQGLERGERCLYIADENSIDEVLDAMRARGIDVDAALESGALSIHTKQDTYLRGGEFDRDSMLEFWENSLEQATDGDGYAGIRAAAEMTWALDGDTNPDLLAEYEAVLNDIYEGEDYAVLCQYNRERFPAAAIHDVIRTHPHLIHDGAVYHNGYYTPPEEFFGPHRTAREVDRMLGTLRERTETKKALKQRREHFEQVFESSHDAILIVDPETDEVIDANPAASEMLGYSRDELLSRGPSDLHPDELGRFSEFVDGAFEDGPGWTDEFTCHTKDRGRIPAEISASRMEYNDRRVMLAAVRDISERKERERAQRRLYEIAADSDRTFDEKLQALFDLGCDRFNLELGGLARIDPDADLFEVEAVSGDHEHLELGTNVALSETYCRVLTTDEETAGVTDPVSDGFDDTLAYDEFGVNSYIGTRIVLDDDLDRTLFFVSSEPRNTAFSEAERTFHHLMGQWVQYELERKEAEEALREEQRRFREMIDALPEAIYTTDPDGDLTYFNPAAVEFSGRTPELGADEWCVTWKLYSPDGTPMPHDECPMAVTLKEDRAIRGAEAVAERPDGERLWFEAYPTPLHDADGELVGGINMLVDITDRKRFERALTNLHEASRDLIQAESKPEVSRRTVEAAKEILDLDGIGIYLFDDAENVLRPAAATEYVQDLFGELPTFGPGDTSITWTAFIDGETITHDDVFESDDMHRRDSPLRSGIWIPLGDHGVLAIVSENVGGFDRRTRRLADHLAATAEATLDRVQREVILRQHEQDLERQNRRLEGLNRMNGIIRGIDQVLVQATSQDAIEQAVCELLTQNDRFAFAWIGDAKEETVTPRTWAGDAQGYLDAISLTTDTADGDPAVVTASTGDVTLVSNVAADLRSGPWRKAALARDLQSVISVPIKHEKVRYGMLTVYASENEAFDQLSREVLEELGEMIANAMNVVETRRALLTDSVVELELAIREADDPLVRLATDTDGQLEIRGIVPQSEGRARVFVTASGVAADTVLTAAAASTRIERVTRIDDADDEDDECRFEVTVAGPTIPSTLVEVGAVARTIQITDTETRAVVDLPPSTDVRTFVDRLETTYSDTELVARRDRERDNRSSQAFETELTGDLTERQLEVLQTAYLSGYFEWPRDRTGEEVAESLDITQSTFNGHLRTAERKLFAILFDGRAASSG